MTSDEQLDLELVRLSLDTALDSLQEAVKIMGEGLRPTLTVPLARQEILNARQSVDLLLQAHHATPQAGEQEKP